MWSSSLQGNKNQTRTFSYPSSSSSTPSSMLPSRRRNIQEVWSDISISPPPPPSSKSVILQDFLAGPVKEGPPIIPADASEEMHYRLPPTALSLSSGLCCSLAARSNHQRQQQEASAVANSDRGQTFGGPPSAAAVFSDINGISGSPPDFGILSFCPTSKPILDHSGSMFDARDRRHKRMMKNRESAARSRARKQAYTNELELELAHLVAENDKLRKQYQELSSAMAAQHSSKKTLQRSLTAPF